MQRSPRNGQKYNEIISKKMGGTQDPFGGLATSEKGLYVLLTVLPTLKLNRKEYTFKSTAISYFNLKKTPGIKLCDLSYSETSPNRISLTKVLKDILVTT